MYSVKVCGAVVVLERVAKRVNVMVVASLRLTWMELTATVT